MLFDTSPTDDPDSATKKKGRKKPLQAAAAHDAAPAIDGGLAAILARRAAILGRLDGVVECHRCLSSCQDITEEDGREWLIECVYCGLKQWSPAISGHLKPKEQGFVLADGRFAGKTIAEAFHSPRGRDYVEWAATEHKRPSVREACKKFLLTATEAVR